MQISFNQENLEFIVDCLKNKNVCVLPSDTLYGISCSVFSKKAVRQIYKLKKREKNKPFIILISKITDLNIFNINLPEEAKTKLSKIWPNKVTVVIDCKSSKFKYLHRGKASLGFRIPKSPLLLQIIDKVGPITSTTVNISGEPPVKNIQQAQELFGNKIKLYIDNNFMDSAPSTVLKISENNFEIIRQGEVTIENLDL